MSHIRQHLVSLTGDEELLFADGFDGCILGIDAHNRVVYSIEKCVETLMERDRMGYTDACEFLAFNTISAYVGERTPIWVNTNLS